MLLQQPTKRVRRGARALTLVARKRQWKLPDSYSWSPKRTLEFVLPRPRWTKRRAAASAQTPPDAPR